MFGNNNTFLKKSLNWKTTICRKIADVTWLERKDCSMVSVNVRKTPVSRLFQVVIFVPFPSILRSWSPTFRSTSWPTSCSTSWHFPADSTPASTPVPPPDLPSTQPPALPFVAPPAPPLSPRSALTAQPPVPPPT